MDSFFERDHKVLGIWDRLDDLLAKKAVRGLPSWFGGKESACQCRRHRFNPLVQEDPTYCRATKPVQHNY